MRTVVSQSVQNGLREAAQANARAAAQAEARKKAAEAERRKRDGVWGNIVKGNLKAAYHNAVDSAADQVANAASYVMSYKNTAGICATGSVSFGTGGSASLCLIRTNRPDGKVDYGVMGTVEQKFGVGVGLTGEFMNSNADDFDQLRGDAAGFGVAAGAGLMVSVSHRGTFGTRNSRGDIVHSGSVGFGKGVGVDFEFGSGKTGITKLWTS
ncbi:hypothetical protein ABTX34_35895 [Streptomyces sp. NPDC096538]|uniref:hypothetical protein n=1 Tax=Streptomyces sp. NPDC096538 TaxID=3155427 RepID=UPI003332842B